MTTYQHQIAPGPNGSFLYPVDGQISSQTAAERFQPQTGLAGSEAALRAALENQLAMSNKYGQAGITALDRTGSEAASALAQARRGVTGSLGQGFGALDRAGRQAGQAVGAAQADLSASEARGLSGIRSAIQKGIAPLSGFVEPGRKAFDVQAALSGALGNDAQRAAFAAFTESPEQAFLREQGQRQVLSGAAATGGLGGGEVQRELVRFGTGLASQDINNRFNRLGDVSGKGLSAASNIGQLRGQQAGLSSNLIGKMAGARGSLAGQLASVRGQLGSAGASLAGQAGGQLANIGMRGADIYSNLGANAANLLQGLGSSQAGMIGRSGELAASNRMATGRDIANAISAGAGNLAQLQQQGGSEAADIVAASGGNIANLVNLYGERGAADLIERANNEANIQMWAAGALGGQTNPAQFVQSGGMVEPIGQLAGGIGGMLQGVTSVAGG